MRGPIDYIIVGFEGNKFDGTILRTLEDALDQNIVGLLALVIVTKDSKGIMTELSLTDTGDDYLLTFSEKYSKNPSTVSKADIDETASLLENDTTAGLLVLEELWAKPLKKALVDAKGVLVADGHIYPDQPGE